jgi:hypothetical protein
LRTPHLWPVKEKAAVHTLPVDEWLQIIKLADACFSYDCHSCGNP